jgi:uncharacterized membrane protein
MGLLKTTDRDGTERYWTLKEVVQGKPLGHPSHVMFVHFPVAFYVGALAFDVASRAGRFPEAPVAATWMLVGALAGSIFAVITGLVDWWGMKPGSRTRRVANRHLLFQAITAVLFQSSLLLRFADRNVSRAETTWIVLEAIGVLTLTYGQYLGGFIVYRIGYRVIPDKPADATPTSSSA